MTNMSPSIKLLAAALIAAQTELPTVTKEKENPFFKSKYVGLDTVLPPALKVLTDHGLGLVQSVGQDSQGGTTLTTMLLHESGEWLSDTQPLLLVKTDQQGQGSAITYARRYGLMAMLGLVGEDDDDGNAASPRQKTPLRRPVPPAPNPAPEKPISEAQTRAIRASLRELFGEDEQSQVEWLTEIEPAAVAGLEVHLGGLSSQQASRIISASNDERAAKARPA